MTWFVIRTNIKGEERALTSLRRAGFVAYAPEMRIERQHKRSKAWLIKALWLMPRYIFVSVPDSGANWFAIRRCDGVEHVLGASNGYGETVPFPIATDLVTALMDKQDGLEFDDTRAAKIKRREIGRNKRETTAMRFPVGSRIRAKDGPFATFGGMVTNVNAKGEVEAIVEIFGRLTPATFPVAQVELAERAKAA